MNESPKQPAIMPSAGTDRPLAHVALADIVRLRKPYQPHRMSGLPEPVGPFSHGIVAEILSVLLDGTPRNVSLYLYNPDKGTLYLGPNGIPEFVDFHCSELELYKRASDQGYIPLVS